MARICCVSKTKILFNSCDSSLRRLQIWKLSNDDIKYKSMKTFKKNIDSFHLKHYICSSKISSINKVIQSQKEIRHNNHLHYKKIFSVMAFLFQI